MLNSPGGSLLGPNDPSPVQVVNPGGTSRFLLLGDHAGNRIPAALGTLGLEQAERERHIGWDIGIAGMGEMLAMALDATFMRQTYSRLVVDCNRDPSAADAIAEVSDNTPVPGNEGLAEADRARRFAEIHEPYQTAIAAEIARRDAGGRDTVLVSLHSFTPVMKGHVRPWQVGVLHDAGDTRFALAVLRALRKDATLTVGDNEPYRMDGIDYTIPRHVYPGRAYVELEIRQDLIATTDGQVAWSRRLGRVLTE